MDSATLESLKILHMVFHLYFVAHAQTQKKPGKSPSLLSQSLTYASGEKSPLPAPQSGQPQSSGISAKAVPGAMPLSGSPSAGS